METKDVIRHHRTRLGLSEQQLADRIGVSRGSVQQWEAGKTMPKRSREQDVADALEITVDELLCRDTGNVIDVQGTFVEDRKSAIAIESGTQTPDDASDVIIPQYDTGGAMGGGLVLQDQPGVIKKWHVSDDWLRLNVHRVTSTKNLAIVTGFGDSMRGMYNPGDPLLVDTGVRSVDFDGVYFFRVENEGFVKRLQRIPGEGILVISENKAYRDWTIKPGADFEVFAKVVKVWESQDF